jgi:DNA polymerase II small subunit/DNA polymerase delta subunit B
MSKLKKEKKDEISFSSKEELEKEVQKELKKFIREEKKLAKDPKAKENKKQDDLFAEIFNNEEIKLQDDIKAVSLMNSLQKVDWFCDKVYSLVNTLNHSMSVDVLNGTEYVERYLLTVLMQEIINLLSTYDVEFSNEMASILVEKQEVELVTILNTLNYL